MAEVREFENNGASVGLPDIPTHSIHGFLQNLSHFPHSNSPLSNMESLSDDLFFSNFDEIESLEQESVPNMPLKNEATEMTNEESIFDIGKDLATMADLQIFEESCFDENEKAGPEEEYIKAKTPEKIKKSLSFQEIDNNEKYQKLFWAPKKASSLMECE